MTVPSRTRKILAGTVAAASLGVGGVVVAAVNPLGVVGAQGEDTTTTTALEDRRGERKRPHILEEVLDGLVAEGTVTQEQADAVQGGVRQGAEEWRAEHPGRRGDHRPGRGRGVPGLRGAVEAAAEAIGVEPDALREALRDGRSIAAVAEEAGVERQAVIDAITAAARERIDQAVADGHLDAERAEALKGHLAEHAARAVDWKRPAR